jgi:RNA polymerase sigma factor (sigma-70 family)
MFEAIVDSKPFVSLLQSGNEKALEFLYEQGIENVVPLLRSQKFDDPEDSWHDCWIELKQSRCSDYDPAQGKLSSWILAYALNHARNVQKKRRRWKETSIDDRPDLAREDVSTEENEGGEQDKAKLLKQASRSIGRDEYRLLHLRYGLGVKSPAIAKKFGTTSAAIRKRISRALQRLREEIERLQEDELRRPAKEPSGADSS